MNNNIKIEELEAFGIHDLRSIARSNGVRGATSMKKDELINKLKRIMTGEDLPSFNQSKVGRPPRDRADIEFISKLMPTSYDCCDPILFKPFNFDIWDQTQLGELKVCSSDKSESCLIRGIVDIHPDGYAVLRVESYFPSSLDAFIASPLIEKYKLKSGDYISGYYAIPNNDKRRILYKLELPGEEIVHNKHRIDFDNLPYNISNQIIESKIIKNIKFGSKILLRMQDNFYDNSINIAEDLARSNDDIYVKILNLKSQPTECNRNYSNIEIINIPFNKTPHEIISGLNLYRNSAVRIVEKHKQVIFIITNFCEVIKAINILAQGSLKLGELSGVAINEVNNLLIKAKYIDEEQSLTIICLDKDFDEKDDFSKLLYNEIYTVFDNMM